MNYESAGNISPVQLKAGIPMAWLTETCICACARQAGPVSVRAALLVMRFGISVPIVCGLLQLVSCLPAQAGPDAFIPPRFKETILYAPVPDYPMAARSHYTTDAQGVYRLTINQQTGAVGQVGVLKYAGHRQLDSAMITTFFKWRFKPGTIKQLDVPVVFERDVRVELKNAAAK